MTIKLSSAETKYMEIALVMDTSESNPFVRDGEHTYMRYDEWHMIAKAGALVIILSYMDKEVYELPINNYSDALKLLGSLDSSGRLLVTIQ